MERLTKKDTYGHWYTNESIYDRMQENEPYPHAYDGKPIDKLADYEDKEEQGLLIELPYPLETEHIYFADENDMDVYKLDAEKIEVHMMPISKKIMYTIDCYEFFIEDFGKIVFLTEAEAEEALAKREVRHEV